MSTCYTQIITEYDQLGHSTETKTEISTWIWNRNWFGTFIKWHINFRGLFNTKSILVEEQQWYDLTYIWDDKQVDSFFKGIGPKVNVIERLLFELADYGVAVEHFSHFTSETPFPSWSDNS